MELDLDFETNLVSCNWLVLSTKSRYLVYRLSFSIVSYFVTIRTTL